MLKLLFRITFLFLYVFSANAQSSFFVDDAENVYKCTSDAVIKYKAGETEGLIVAGGNGRGGAVNQLNNPRSVIVDEKENIYICDTGNHRIQKWEKGAKMGISVAGGNGAGSAANQLNYPNSFVFDSKGNVYINDSANKRIQFWEKGKVLGQNIFSYFVEINHLNIDQLDNIYVCVYRQILKSEPKLIDFKPIPVPQIYREVYPSKIYIDRNSNYIIGNEEVNQLIKTNSKATKAKLLSYYYYGHDFFVDRNNNIWIDNGDQIYKYIESTKEPLLGQFLTAETIIDGNAPSINNQFQISPGSKFTQDKKGNIYVIETAKDRILKANADGKSYTVVAGGNGRGGAANQLDNPSAVIVDEKENIYICDRDNHRIQKWEKGSKSGITVAGGNGAGSASNQLNFPKSFVFDPKGRLTILDGAIPRIIRYEQNQKTGNIIFDVKKAYPFKTILLNGFVFINESELLISTFEFNTNDWRGKIQKWNIVNQTFSNYIPTNENEQDFLKEGYPELFPGELLLDRYQNLYVLSFETRELRLITPGAKFAKLIENSVAGIFLDKKGNLWISQFTNNFDDLKISKTNKQKEPNQYLLAETIIDGNAPSINNQFQISPGSKFTQDKKGNIYIIETGNDRILKASADGKSYTVVAGGNGKGSDANQLNLPWDIAIDDAENIYVVDTYNHRIQKWAKGSLNGVTVAGGNGSGNKSNQFSYPRSIVFNNKKNLLIADYSNNRIQKWVLGKNEGETIAGILGTHLDVPFIVRIDSSDNIYTSGADLFSTLLKWEKGTFIGKKINGIDYVRSFDLDENENIYFIDGNTKLNKWNKKEDKIFELILVDSNRNEYMKRSGSYDLVISTTGEILISDGRESKLIKVNPTVKIAEKSTSQKMLTEYNGAYFLTPSNELIAKIIPDEANLAMGEVTASVHIDSAQSQGFVKRRYKIETNDAAHKSQITLYFTQADFDAYNQNNTTKLPNSPTDKAGIAQAQLIATKSGPVSSRLASLKPRLLKIKQLAWNDELKLWALTFGDSGSHEYWLQTKPIFKTGQAPQRPVIAKNGRLAAHEEAEINQILLYPNPATDRLTVQIGDKELLGTEMKLVNEIGQTMSSFKIKQPTEQINVVKLKKGMYFLNFANRKSMKFIRE